MTASTVTPGTRYLATPTAKTPRTVVSVQPSRHDGFVRVEYEQHGGTLVVEYETDHQLIPA